VSDRIIRRGREKRLQDLIRGELSVSVLFFVIFKSSRTRLTVYSRLLVRPRRSSPTTVYRWMIVRGRTTCIYVTVSRVYESIRIILITEFRITILSLTREFTYKRRYVQTNLSFERSRNILFLGRFSKQYRVAILSVFYDVFFAATIPNWTLNEGLVFIEQYFISHRCDFDEFSTN